MPAETNGRRSFRKMTTDEEAEIRRARGEISCAECRRLKLKCDKKLPCSSCIRRGCPSICPNGTLTTGHGTRYVLSDTTQLHHKIAEMGQRIRQLEDAVAIFQAGVSNEPHPLMREPLLSIKFGPEVHDIHTREGQPKADEQKVASTIDALGTLTIGDRGHAKYFGTSGGSEALFYVDSDGDACNQESTASPLEDEIQRLSNYFPLNRNGGWDTEKCLELLYASLPSQQRAWALCEVFWQHASWQYRPIERDEVINDILTPVYKLSKEPNGCSKTSIVSPHKLAILFIIFAIGTLMDRTLPPYSPEAEKYHQCGKAALSLRSLFDSPELSTVQAMALLSFYNMTGGKHYSVDAAWALHSLACKLAQSMGLHRDPAGFDMEPRVVQRWRFLFWEMYATDVGLSFALGRPPSIRSSYVDCQFPTDDEETLDSNGGILEGYYSWKRNFMKDVYAPMIEDSLSAKGQNYQMVLDWDRKVRETTLPEHLYKMYGPEEDPTPYEYMRGGLLKWQKIMALLHVHRSFFTQAMLEHPLDPLRSPYAPSFLAAYRCASGIITRVMNNFARFPDIYARFWNTWTHLFSAAAIVGVIVSRFPSSSMAPKAFVELGIALDLFRKHANDSPRAKSGLVLLARMRDKAFESYQQYSIGQPQKPMQDDDLAIFGGHTRVLVSRRLTHQTKSTRRSASSSSDSPDSERAKFSSSSEPESSTYSSPHSTTLSGAASPTFYPTAAPLPASIHHYLNPPVPMGSSADFFGDPSFATQESMITTAWPTTYNEPFTSSPTSQEYVNGMMAPPDIRFAALGGHDDLGHQENGSPASNGELGHDTMQMGITMMGESGMMDNEQWLAFMRQTGLFGDGNTGFTSQPS